MKPTSPRLKRAGHPSKPELAAMSPTEAGPPPDPGQPGEIRCFGHWKWEWSSGEWRQTGDAC
jgi:hypothetical protein